MPGDSHALLIGIDRYPLLPGRDLRGCKRDVALMRSVLVERFDIPEEHVATVLDEAATRDGILAALAALEARVGADDSVVLYYAGHGSQLRDPRDPAAMIESLVPHDSGRDPHPNRDILDRELDAVIRRLAQQTDNLTLLIDCCHSGSVTRDVGGARTRRVPPDLRDAAAMRRPVELASTRSLGGLAEPKGQSGWLPARRAVLLAACRADELANEHDTPGAGPDVLHHGAFTFHLGAELARASPDATWRSVFERVAPAVVARHRRQHPQLEGPRDRRLFQTATAPPRAYLPVVEIAAGHLTIGGGAAHGAVIGARYRVVDGADELGVATVTAVGAARATLRWAGGEVPLGARAELLSSPEPGRLRVRVDEPLAAIRPTLAGSPWLEIVDAAPADVTLTERDRAWVGVGSDGRWAVRAQAPGPGAAGGFLTDLEGVARFRDVARLAPPPGCGQVGDTVSLRLERALGDGSLAPADAEPDGGLVVYEEGDRAEVVITNDGRAAVWVSLLELGVDGAIAVLYPDPDAPPHRHDSQRLEPGASVRLAADHYGMPDGLPLSLPQGFPWAAEPGEDAASGTLTFQLMVTSGPADFSGLAQGATRSFRPQRRGPDDDWAVIRRTVAVRRRQGALTLDGTASGAADGATGIVVEAPGWTGEARVMAGGGARTRALAGTPQPVDDALFDAGVRTVAVVMLDARPSATRSVTPPVTTPGGEAGVRVRVPAAGSDDAVAALVFDDDGFARWVFGRRDAGASWVLVVPHAVGAAAGGQTRGWISDALRRARSVIRVLAWRAVDLAGAAGATVLAAWELAFRGSRLRSFTPADFGRRDALALADADWPRLAEGPALLFVHGTFSSVHEGYAELSADLVQTLHERYAGRVFGFDHPTLSRDPEANARWLLQQVPADTALTLDIVSHSRGGLVARSLAAIAPALTGGRVRVRRLICVGTPNRGTPLTDTDHSEGFLTLLTHAAVIGPPAALRLVVAGVAQLAKVLCAGLAANLPGLQAMHPRGEFLAHLAALEEAAKRGVDVFAITADYEPPEGVELSGLQRFAKVLRETVFRDANDLVVPTEGVYGDAPSPWFPVPAERRLVLRTADVLTGEAPWHNAFFARDDVREQLLAWLRGDQRAGSDHGRRQE